MKSTSDNGHPIHSGSRWEPMPGHPTANQTTSGSAPVEAAIAAPRPTRPQRWPVIAFLTLILTAGTAAAGMTLAAVQDGTESGQTTRVTRPSHPDSGSGHRRDEHDGESRSDSGSGLRRDEHDGESRSDSGSGLRQDDHDGESE